MEKSTYKWLAIVIAMGLFFGAAACAEAPRGDVERAADSGAALEEAGEHDEGSGEARSEEAGEHGEGGEGRGEESRERRGEHGESGETHDEGSEGGEESGVYIGRDETWDVTRRGARLVLTFNASRNAFVGTVENTTEQTLCAVRVEVHLDTPKELGPTERTDLRPGTTTGVELLTEGERFETWTAHPEMSSCSGDQ